jgi:hypothetical protein
MNVPAVQVKIGDDFLNEAVGLRSLLIGDGLGIVDLGGGGGDLHGIEWLRRHLALCW